MAETTVATPPALSPGEMLRLATRLDRGLSRGFMAGSCQPTEHEWRGIIDALRIAAAGLERRPEANAAIDWDLVQWRSAFRAASAASDAKLTALLLELRAEAVARGTVTGG